MGTMRIALFGQNGNLLARAASVTVTSEHTQLTKDRLYDGRPSRAYRAAGLVTDLTITADGQAMLNGGLNSWPSGIPEFWTVLVSGTASVEAESTTKTEGTNSARLVCTGTEPGVFAMIVQTWSKVRAGEKRRCKAQARGNGVAAATKMRLRNMVTGNYLQSGGTWASTANTFASRTAATFDEIGLDYTVESYAACGENDQVTLQLEIYNDVGNSTTYVDDVADFPAHDFISVHGHNIPPYIVAEFRSDNAAFAGAGTLRQTLTKTSPSFYGLLADAVYDRYWRLKLVGTPFLPATAIELGEVIIGQMRQPLQAHETPILSGSRWDRQASVTPGGERHVHKRSKWQARSRVFTFHFSTQAKYDDALELFHLRPEGDTYPVVIVPDTALPTVIHGRLRADFPDSLILLSYYRDVAVELEESPFAPSTP